MLCVLPDRGGVRHAVRNVGAGVSDTTVGKFELTFFEGPENGNVCWIKHTLGGREQTFLHVTPEDLRDLAYVVDKALRALVKYE